MNALNRTELFKNFAIGFIPIFVFIVADSIWGTETGLIVAIAVGLAYLFYYLIRYKRLEKFILFDTALIVLLGGVSILLHDEIFFKLKPALIELILVIILGIHAFSSKPILLMMSKRFMGDIDLGSDQVKLMRQMSQVMFILFLLHTALIVYSAYFWSKEVWAFISGGLFYIIFGLVFVGQWVYMKYIKPAPGRKSASRKEEWFDIVDERGNVINKAPRSQVHGNPNLIHQTVHLHVFNSKNQLFLQKRVANKDLYPGRWDTAVGGHVDSGETVDAALKRESMEELGIELHQAKPLFRYIMRNQWESEMIHAFEIIHDGPFNLDPKEIETGRFWSGFELQKMMGQGIFTPNFEQEFTMLKKMGRF
ncbi:MAG: NUDIX domain-containing protein [Calditrichaceae bacterium]|nr:NUDIX domain-containing protein [Calditrichaceae bacterium]